jgi:hypothetical protein
MDMLAALLLALVTARFEPVTPLTTAQTEQVFVHDASAPAQPFGDGAGHAAGLRPPRETDSDAAPLFTATGTALNTTIAGWRAAGGNVELDPTPDGGTRIRATFAKLIPRGRYSVFMRQLAGRSGAVLTPVDITGAADSFLTDVDGNGQITVTSPSSIPAGAQLVLIYHSDGVDHVSSVGNPGVNAHAQLITRVP